MLFVTLRSMNVKIRTFLQREIDARHLVRGLLAMAPDLLLYAWTGSLLWFHGALVTICLLIVQTRLSPSLSLLVLHALTLAILTALFYLTIPYTFVFAVVAAAVGFMTFWITRLDSRLLSFGNWNFIPPLYIACEMTANAAGVDRWLTLEQLLLVWPISIASAALVLRPPVFAPIAVASSGWRRWFGLPLSDSHSTPTWKITRAASARATAVLLATGLMEWSSMGHAEWGIWSAASVVNTSSSQAVEKFRHRALGAAIGVASGLLLGPFLPHSEVLYVIAALAMFLTLTVIKRYPVAFGTRCFLVTIAAYATALGMNAGFDRVTNVIAGSLVGLAVTLIFRSAYRTICHS